MSVIIPLVIFFCIYPGLLVQIRLTIWTKIIDGFVKNSGNIDNNTEIVLISPIGIMLIIYGVEPYRKLGANPTQERCCINGVILQ